MQPGAQLLELCGARANEPVARVLEALERGAPSVTFAARCASYVRRLELPLAMPSALRARVQTRHWWQTTWLAPVALVTAALVALLASPLLRPADEVRTKGSPAVSVFVKRGEQVMGWDGQAPVQTGDALRLEVQPERFGQLTVLSGERELFRGPATAPRQALPLSWRVDAEPADVELSLVFSRSPVTLAVALNASRQLLRNDQVWSTRLVLHKAAAADAAP